MKKITISYNERYPDYYFEDTANNSIEGIEITDKTHVLLKLADTLYEISQSYLALKAERETPYAQDISISSTGKFHKVFKDLLNKEGFYEKN